MAKLKVPNRYRSGMAKLLSLDELSFKELVAGLKEIQPTINIAELKSIVAPKITTFEVSDDILVAILSLYGARIGLDMPLDEFIDEIFVAAEDIPDVSIDLRDERLGIYKELLTTLLSISSFTEFVKATDLITEHQNILLETRIISDIRPIFGADVTDPPLGALIIHTLKICYSNFGQVNEFFITIDEADIEKFIKVLKRAKDKGETLRNTLDKGGIAYITIK